MLRSKRIFKTAVFYCFLLLLFSLPVIAQDSSFSQQEIIYGRKDGMALTMIHLKPINNTKRKAIIRVISGNWVSNNRRIADQLQTYQSFLKKGYTIFLVMHGSQPRYAIPDQVLDLQKAVRHIRYKAKDYGIDPKNIGITGYSSGGNLALLVATADEKTDSTSKDPVDKVSSRVQAIAVYFPPTDFFNWGQKGFSFSGNEKILTLSKIAGAFDFKKWNDTSFQYESITALAERNKIYREVSPLYAVTADDPPVLIIHGDKDRVVPLQQSESIIAKFAAAQVPNRFILKKGEGHGWDNDPAENDIFMEWFDKYLK